jgi:ATP-dependent DNA helicase RecG
VFWVVPRVEEPEAGDDEAETEEERLMSVVTRARVLGETLGTTNVGIVHGGLSATEKRRVMESFRAGESPVLVGTTVIEVGVDVPEATLMVVEDCERFGLAQLHQLRGRVGRGERPGHCVLFHGDDLSALAKARLAALASLDNGEDVAKADLELRGAGDLGGTRQHGAEEDLVYLEPNATYPWLERIEEDARGLFGVDPKLEAGEHAVLGSLTARLGRVIAVREEAG